MQARDNWNDTKARTYTTLILIMNPNPDYESMT